MKITCSCCQRPFSMKESVAIIADIEAKVRSWPVDEYPFGRGFSKKLLDGGIHRVGDVMDAGDDLLDVRGIGPAWYRWIREVEIPQLRTWIMEERRVE